MEDTTTGEGTQEEANPYEFPVTNLYELEGRVFAEHWSIPYKKDESLGKCLVAAANLAEAGNYCYIVNWWQKSQIYKLNGVFSETVSGAVKLIVCIAQVVPYPVWTSGNFQEFTIYKYHTDQLKMMQVKNGQVSQNQILPALSM